MKSKSVSFSANKMKIFIPNYKEFIEKTQLKNKAIRESKYMNEEEDRVRHIKDVCNNRSVILDSKPVDKSKYTRDLYAKMSAIRLDLFTQMGVIDQINEMRTILTKKADLSAILRRMSTRSGLPK